MWRRGRHDPRHRQLLSTPARRTRLTHAAANSPIALPPGSIQTSIGRNTYPHTASTSAYSPFSGYLPLSVCSSLSTYSSLPGNMSPLQLSEPLFVRLCVHAVAPSPNSSSFQRPRLPSPHSS